ncbi:MAG: 6,7-dimethyl-8-ribityllumazine synthase [Actinobacteria bacterium]|nr:6,7-dimethyl-8-ribityllumazine synthase [Actinomycetota bacterium]
MSGAGSPTIQLSGLSDLKVAVVASMWHDEIMTGLINGALETCAAAGVTEPKLVRVTGSFELPVVARALTQRGYDAVIALGVIIRGGTPHFEYVSAATSEGLVRVAIDSGVPVGFGLLTCDNEEQARDRAGLPSSRESKGREAAEAALSTAMTLRTL